MRRVAPLALGLVMCGGVAQAQELIVRSGDHPSFSRITIPIPTSQTWEASQTLTGVEVSLPGFKEGFDTSSVFLRMRRERISKLSEEGHKLVLTVECECIATAFRSGPLLVIDVADQGAILQGPQLEARAIVKKTPPPTARSPLPWIGGGSVFGGSAVDINPFSYAGKSDSATDSTRSQLAERATLLNAIQQNLAEQVANATSVGLLENSYKKPQKPPLLNDKPGATQTVEPKQLPANIEERSNNIRFTNSMERTGDTIRTMANATSSGFSCPQDDFLPIETWGNDDSFSAQVGAARNALTDARDRLNKDAAKSLAKTYIYFGFGAEALNTLQLTPSLAQEGRHLADIAQILEYGSINRPNTLSQFTDCASNVALWASLSFEEIPADALVNVDAALLTLNKLPSHLRQLVAPELSRRLLNYGEPAAAAAAMRSVERLPGVLRPESLMAQADLAIDAGIPAETFLEDVIKTNSEQSPNALIKMIKSKLARNEPLSSETATLVEAYAQEFRGTELGSQLRQTQIIALSQSGRFQEAFAALDAIEPSISPTTAQDLQKVIFDQLHQKANDLVFLEQVLSAEDDSIQSLPTNIKLLLTTRLLNLGFPVQAQEILLGVPDAPRTPERQILAARTAIQLRQPFQAQAALIGIEGNDAELLLAQAKEMTGAYSEASEIFSNNDAPEQAAQAAWLSDDWRDLTSSNTNSFGAVAALATTPNDASEIGPLGRATRALEESSQARNALDTLLNDPALQITPDS